MNYFKVLLITIFISFNAHANDPYIVLIPGAASSGPFLDIQSLNSIFKISKQESYFHNLSKILNRHNFQTIVCPRYRDRDRRSLSSRARDCNQFLKKHSQHNPYATYHILGHSMGGLVGRKLIQLSSSQLPIKSLTTISTPHRCSVLASFAIENNHKTMLSSLLKSLYFSPDQKEYIHDLKIDNNKCLYTENLKAPLRVPIYSISNYKDKRANFPFQITANIISKNAKRYKNRSIINDGIIETSSMFFGKHLGTIKANHMESICILHTVRSQGCKNSLKLLLPHFKKLIH